VTEHVRIANPTRLQQQSRFCSECGRPLAGTTDAAGTPYRACHTLLGEIEAEEEPPPGGNHLMPRRRSLTSTLYRAARASNNLRAARKGPLAFATRRVR
jgi:hypothetical protein